MKYWARLGCWISSCYGPFSFGARFETYELFLSLILELFFRVAVNRTTVFILLHTRRYLSERPPPSLLLPATPICTGSAISVGVFDMLQTGHPVNLGESPVERQNCPGLMWGPASVLVSTGGFSSAGRIGWGMKLTVTHHLVPSLGMGGLTASIPHRSHRNNTALPCFDVTES
jgi:hypothetical protein